MCIHSNPPTFQWKTSEGFTRVSRHKCRWILYLKIKRGPWLAIKEPMSQFQISILLMDITVLQEQKRPSMLLKKKQNIKLKKNQCFTLKQSHSLADLFENRTVITVLPGSGKSTFKLTDDAEHKLTLPPPWSSCKLDTTALNTTRSWWEEKLGEETTLATPTAVQRRDNVSDQLSMPTDSLLL